MYRMQQEGKLSPRSIKEKSKEIDKLVDNRYYQPGQSSHFGFTKRDIDFFKASIPDDNQV